MTKEIPQGENQTLGRRQIKGERIILAAGSGYLAKLLAEELAARGCEVIVLNAEFAPARRMVR